MNLRDYKQIEIEPIIDITIYKQTENEHKQQITYNKIHYTSILVLTCSCQLQQTILVPTCSCHQANIIHYTSILHSMI